MYIAIHFSHCNELHDSIVFIALLLIIVYNYPGRDVISIHVSGFTYGTRIFSSFPYHVLFLLVVRDHHGR